MAVAALDRDSGFAVCRMNSPMDSRNLRHRDLVQVREGGIAEIVRDEQLPLVSNLATTDRGGTVPTKEVMYPFTGEPEVNGLGGNHNLVGRGPLDVDNIQWEFMGGGPLDAGETQWEFVSSGPLDVGDIEWELMGDSTTELQA